MSGCCGIDPIHHGGIYIPLLAPVFRCLPLLHSFFLSLRRPSRAHQPYYRWGGFSRATAYAATFLGALARVPFPFFSCHHPIFATTRDPLATPSSHRSKMQRPLSTRQIFSSPAQRHSTRVARSGRLHDFWNFRSCDRELLR